MAEVLIELGELGQRPDPVQRRPRPRHYRRRAVLGAVVVALLLALASSGGRPPRLSELLWSQPQVDFFTLGPDTLYTVQSAASVVEAREPDTGAVRWRLPVDGRPVYVRDLDHDAAVVIVDAGSGQAGADESSYSSLLIRVGTGQVVARDSGEPWTAGNGQLVLVRHDDDCGRAESCERLVAIDTTTGAQRWTLPLGYRTSVAADDRGDRFSTVDIGADAVQIRSQATGAILSEVALPPEFGQGLDYQRVISLVGDRLTIGYRQSDRVVLEGHPVAGGGGSWTASLPTNPNQPEQTTWFYAGACAGLLCVNIDATTALLDPATGRVRGRTDGDVLIGAGGQTGSGHQDETLAVSANPFQRPDLEDNIRLIRTADGSQIASFGGSRVVYWVGSHGRYLLRQEVNGQTAFSVVDWRGYQLRLGEVTGAQLECQATEEIVACVPPAGELRVWRLPTADALDDGLR